MERYERYQIKIKKMPPLFKIPHKYEPIVNKFELFKMITSEFFHNLKEGLKKRKLKDYIKLTFSRPCKYGVFSGRFGGFKPIREKCVRCFECKIEYPRVIKDVIINPHYKVLEKFNLSIEDIDTIKDDIFKKFSIDVLTYLVSIFKRESDNFKVIDYERRGKLKECEGDLVLVVDSLNFPPEGDDSLARFLVESYKKGYKKFIVFNLRGQRFIGCGFGKNSKGVRIDCYGDIGDYAGSGIDGLEIYIHSSGQDQMLNIIKSGKAVIYGDAGQTFMYGAKGGKVFVMGNLAGRPLINAVGNPKVVINGTCLDYLAESFMAGDPLNGGGFCILNGIRFNRKGEIEELDEVYPGSNLMSLPSGGAIYVRDPYRKIEENQLHGSKIEDITEGDLNLIMELLKENESLFDIKIEELLRVRGGDT